MHILKGFPAYSAIIALALLPGCSLPEFVNRGPFELTVSKGLEVFHNGKLLIANDELTYGKGWQAGKLRLDQTDDLVVLNTFQRHSDVMRFRREVGVSAERIELTCQFRLFPYQNSPDTPRHEYTFRIPFERLKNSNYKALRDRASRVKVVEGRLSETRRDGVIVGDARYIAFEGENLRLVIDLNPKGLSTNMDSFSGGGFIGVWRVAKKGDYVEFSFGRAAKFHGGTAAGKALIYEGEYAFDKVHAYQTYREIGGYQIDRRFFFGARSAPPGWNRGDAKPYDAEAGFGWADAEGIALTKNSGKGLVHNAAFGSGRHTFIRDVTPGIFAASLRVGGIEAGPFDIALNGEVIAKDVTVKKGDVMNIHLWKYVRSDKLRIDFSSDKRWAVSTLITQPLIYTYEDFAFDRGPWLIENVFTPED